MRTTIATLTTLGALLGSPPTQAPQANATSLRDATGWIYADDGVGVTNLAPANRFRAAPIETGIPNPNGEAHAMEASILTSEQIAQALGIHAGILPDHALPGSPHAEITEVEIVSDDFDQDGQIDVGVTITGVVQHAHDWQVAQVLFIDQALAPKASKTPRVGAVARMIGGSSEVRMAIPTCTYAVQCCAEQPNVANIEAPVGFDGQQLVATCSTDIGSEYVVGMVDLNNQCSAQLGFSPTAPHAHEPPMFHNEGGGIHEWTRDNLGTVFGLTLDNAGHIYVTATSAYNTDVFPTVHGPGTGGEIYRLDRNTGDISLFATLPNSGQGLGNITYDCRNSQFFVSNLEDGLIYRIPKNPFLAGSPYDHGVEGRAAFGFATIDDIPSQGFTPRGRRVWGLEVASSPPNLSGSVLDHYRLYYAVWWEHDNTPDPNGENNEIWSVGLDPQSGGFLPNTARREFVLPNYATSNWSNPVSDISFRPDGVMLLAERTMISDTSVFAHRSRVLAYQCHFALFTRMFSGGNEIYQAMGVSGPSSAGGIDYDPLTYGSCQGRVWATIDQLTWPSPFIYGLAGINRNGGSALDGTSILIDLDANYGNVTKSQLGDVEIPCTTCYGPFPCR